ncbi:hypothetical protein M8J76_007027 [Diaphorina citri]|nr:hypothetical protein M8J75_013614 [Diaphorina citri]KAI5719221.1 hypothetical protein M8J76_007027 [Diaphorina citri]KAI5721233.1 hypothetical protein M8J77_017962 [Diaphorina citri]
MKTSTLVFSSVSYKQKLNKGGRERMYLDLGAPLILIHKEGRMQSMNGNRKSFYNNNNSSNNIPSNSNYPDSMNSSSSGSPPSSIDTSLYTQHEELIRFITDSWNRVCHQFKDYNHRHSAPQVKYYNSENAESNDSLKHFTPVDLEALWGRQLHQNLVQRNSQPF